MKKLEPGMLCRVVGSVHPDNNGRIVTLVSFSAKPPIPSVVGGWGGNDWWEIEEHVWTGSTSGATLRKIPYIQACKLEPINPDHQPADEEWQEDFKRLLSGDRQGVNSGA